jgi:hypothetical protein
MNVIVVKYDLATGLFAGQNECPLEAAHLQTTEGQGWAISTRNVIESAIVEGEVITSLNFAGVEEWLRTKIDTEAGAMRKLYITDVPGQAQTYERKEREARSWTAGDETANPGSYPFMIAEATVRAVPIEQVRDEIMAQVNALVPFAALIEAHRVAAKLAVAAAMPNLRDMVSAGSVDWATIVTQAGG